MSELSDLRREYARATKHNSYCAICWAPFWNAGGSRRMELAHIVSRGRSAGQGNRVENVIFLCDRCHGSHHHGEHYTIDGNRWPNLTDSDLIAAKRELGELDHVVLAGLNGCTVLHVESLLAAAELPEKIRRERQKWAPSRNHKIDSTA